MDKWFKKITAKEYDDLIKNKTRCIIYQKILLHQN